MSGIAKRTSRTGGWPVALALAAGLLAAGCATYYHEPGYVGPHEVGRAHHSELGTVRGYREVLVRSDGHGGAILGAVTGGSVGAALGGDAGGSLAGGLIGALIGGVIGSEIERSGSEHPAIDYLIEMDSGRTIRVIQARGRIFPPGARVRVLFGDHVRVIPARPGEEDYRDYDEGPPYPDEEPYGPD